jgi:Flp pilus assembly protein TadD
VSGWKSLLQQLRIYSEREWIRIAFLVVLGVAARLPALQGELLWDDHHLVAENPLIRSPILILEAFRHYLFPDSVGGHYRPVQTVSYIFDYLIWNRGYYGYHLSNILLHVAGGCLLYKLLRRLISGGDGTREKAVRSLGAFFAALIWVVHPVHSAAVDYVSGRADSLACVFGCGGWLLFLRTQEIQSRVRRRINYGLAAFLGLLAICSRESGFLWFFLFLFQLFIFDKKTGLKTKLLAFGCCVALTGLYAGLRQMPAKPSSSETTPGVTQHSRAVLMLRALGDYGQLMIWPANLHMERTVLESTGASDKGEWTNKIPAKYLGAAGIIFGLILIYGACRCGPMRSLRIFGVSWFVLTYLPISNLIDLNATVAEHWLYLPSIGFFIFVVSWAVELPARVRKVAMVVGCVAVMGLSARSFVRSSDWVDPETFYRRTLLAGGTSVRMAVNLAAIYTSRGEPSRAESILRKVIKLDPTYLVARNNLGATLSAQGKSAEAEEMFHSASNPTAEERENFPRTWSAALSLARAAHGRNDDEGALAIIKRARSEYPRTWALLSFEAELVRRTKGAAVAFPLVEQFTKENWWHCEAAIALGRLCAELGDVTGADVAWRRASWLDIYGVEALNLMAEMDLRLGRYDQAVKLQRRAVSRQPEQPSQYVLLNDILVKTGRTEEATAILIQLSKVKAMARASASMN